MVIPGSSVVERRAVNSKVVGSNPTRGAELVLNITSNSLHATISL